MPMLQTSASHCEPSFATIFGGAAPKVLLLPVCPFLTAKRVTVSLAILLFRFCCGCRGQDLASPMSHKSYRPLATLSFRAQHWLASSLGRGRGKHLPQLCSCKETASAAVGLP